MYSLNDEIRRIVEYQNSIKLKKDKMTKLAVDKLIRETIDKIKKNTYDFNLSYDMIIRKNGNTRRVKCFKDWSSEEIICIYLKRCLDRTFHIKYPNRNNYIHTLFDVLSAVKDMGDYSIIKFDFKNFFNSISCVYVYNKFITDSKLERFQKTILLDFANSSKYCYAGFNTSNVMAEIIASQFDIRLKQYFFNKGLIFYRRYIDDGILIFNQYISKDDCINNLEQVINEVFFDNKIVCLTKCKTKLNKNKFNHITKRDLNNLPPTQFLEFDFLGYLFRLKLNKKFTDFTFGITQQKMDKYSKQVDKIIDEYISNKKMELLRHRLAAFSSRTVYRVNRYNGQIWKTKGLFNLFPII